MSSETITQKYSERALRKKKKTKQNKRKKEKNKGEKEPSVEQPLG